VLQLHIPHNYIFWDDFYSFFCKFFSKPFLRNKIDPMPLIITIKYKIYRKLLPKWYFNPCRHRITAYTVHCLVQDRQYICDSPSTTALTVDFLIQDGQCAQSLDNSLISLYWRTTITSLFITSVSTEVEFPLYPVKRAKSTTNVRFSVTGLTS
jgi:hypothetical protein